jgi:hypothetical protein
LVDFGKKSGSDLGPLPILEITAFRDVLQTMLHLGAAVVPTAVCPPQICQDAPERQRQGPAIKNFQPRCESEKKPGLIIAD